MKLWIAYDDSPAKLPLCTETSAGRLAEKLGVNENTVRSMAHRLRTGEYKYAKYACIEVEDEYE